LKVANKKEERKSKEITSVKTTYRTF